MPPWATPQLVRFLRERLPPSAGLLDRAKIAYRPLICPFEDLLSLLSPGDAVLDIGCGSGTFLALVERFREPGRVGGIEISADLIARSRELLGSGESGRAEARLETYDGRAFPAFVAEYDTVFLIDVLHHVPPIQQRAFLRALKASMKPGARLVLKDIDASRRFWTLFNKAHDLLLSGEVGHEVTCAEAIALLNEAGFATQAPVKRRMLVYPHFTVVATAM